MRVDFGHAYGWDMTAALAMGQARGLSGWLILEVMPDLERVVLAALAAQREAKNGS